MEITLRGWKVSVSRSDDIFSVVTTRADRAGVTGCRKTHSGARGELAYAFTAHSVESSTHEQDSDLVKAQLRDVEFSLQVMQSGELQMYCSGLPDYGLDHIEWVGNEEDTPSCELQLEIW